MTNSKSFWYTMAAFSGLVATVSAVYGCWGWVAYNGTMVFVNCALAGRAPDE